jgi:hypothetical protein
MGTAVGSSDCRYSNTLERFRYERVARCVLRSCKWFDEAAVKFIMERITNETIPNRSDSREGRVRHEA